jgi:uncharacterized membrane protein YraQ (UPF0718 family)
LNRKLKWLGSLFFLAFLLTVIAFGGFSIPDPVVDKLPQVVTVFVSIVIQAMPFVLIAVFGSALMQTLVTVEMVEERLARTHRLSGILLAIGAGFFFPVCDCGVIPVVRRLLIKRVPPYMALAFLITAPLVNPITIWATATAFGYSPVVTLTRVGMAVGVGLIVALLAGKYFRNVEDVLRATALSQSGQEPDHFHGEAHCCGEETAATHEPALGAKQGHSRIAAIFEHANEEFLEVGKLLVIGAMLAATIQTAVPKQALLLVTANPAWSVLTMMLLAFCLSLCAEADAFVARSFTYQFPMGSVMAFMVFGQMLDIKNILLLWKSFRPKAILFVLGWCALLVFIGCVWLNLFSANMFKWGRF